MVKNSNIFLQWTFPLASLLQTSSLCVHIATNSNEMFYLVHKYVAIFPSVSSNTNKIQFACYRYQMLALRIALVLLKCYSVVARIIITIMKLRVSIILFMLIWMTAESNSMRQSLNMSA